MDQAILRPICVAAVVLVDRQGEQHTLTCASTCGGLIAKHQIVTHNLDHADPIVAQVAPSAVKHGQGCEQSPRLERQTPQPAADCTAPRTLARSRAALLLRVTPEVTAQNSRRGLRQLGSAQQPAQKDEVSAAEVRSLCRCIRHEA